MREFLDERQAQDMAAYSYAIKNKTWESTISVDRAALEDDLYGQIALRIKQMAAVAKTHLDTITFGLLGTGFTSLCYDGQPFFGTHPASSLAGARAATQSNLGTDALTAASLARRRSRQMMRYTDDQGRPAGIMPTLLVIPPELYWEASQLLNSTLLPGPAAGRHAGPGDQPAQGHADAPDDAVPVFPAGLVPAGHAAGGQGAGLADAEGLRVQRAGRQLGRGLHAGSVSVRGPCPVQRGLWRLAGRVWGAGGVDLTRPCSASTPLKRRG